MKLREIDQLVATKVLNWEHHVSVYTWGELFSPEKYTTKEGREILPHELPHFSTYLLDAWKVVEELRDLGFYVSVKTPPKAKSSSYWVCVEDFYTEKSFTACGLTVPLAICLAALKTVGIDVEVKFE